MADLVREFHYFERWAFDFRGAVIFRVVVVRELDLYFAFILSVHPLSCLTLDTIGQVGTFLGHPYAIILDELGTLKAEKLVILLCNSRMILTNLITTSLLADETIARTRRRRQIKPSEELIHCDAFSLSDLCEPGAVLVR